MSAIKTRQMLFPHAVLINSPQECEDAARSLGRAAPWRQAQPGENRSSLYQIAVRREGEAELLLARQVALEDSRPCAQEILERLVGAGAEVRAQRMAVDAGV